MNEYFAAYLGACQKRASIGDRISGALNSIGDYKPFADENLGLTSRVLGGVGGAIPTALLGGAIGTVKGWSEDRYDENGKKVRPGWFLRGLAGGAKGMALGAGIGAGLGAWTAGPNLRKGMEKGMKDFVETGRTSRLLRGGVESMGPMAKTQAGRAAIVGMTKNVPLGGFGEVLSDPNSLPRTQWRAGLESAFKNLKGKAQSMLPR